MDYIDQILKTLHNFGLNFASHIPNIIIAILFLVITHFVAKLISHLLGASISKWMRSNLVLVFQKMAAIFVWFLGIMIVAAIVFPSVTPANLLATFGLTSVAIGFAFKDIFENFFAGIIILLREPFHVGDFIQMKDEQGYVEYISVRNTHIRQTDGARVVIPNGMLFTNPTRVLTDLSVRRVESKLSLDFGVDIEKAKDMITKTIKKCETVNKEKYIQVFVTSYSSNGVDFHLYWWTGSKPSDIRKSHDEVLTEIYNALVKARIDFSYSTPLNFLNHLLVKKVDKEKHEKK